MSDNIVGDSKTDNTGSSKSYAKSRDHTFKLILTTKTGWEWVVEISA